MNGNRTKKLRKETGNKHPGRKHGGAKQEPRKRDTFRPDVKKAWPVGVLRFANTRNAERARQNGV